MKVSPELVKWACRIARDAMLKQRRQYSLDAQTAMFLGGAQNPKQQRALTNYNQLSEAIEILRKVASE